MKSQVFKLFLLLLLLSPLESALAGNEFSISVSGPRENMSYFKVSAELKTVGSKKFCTKKEFPMRMSTWHCLDHTDGLSDCRTNFRCTKESRKVSSRRAIFSLKKKLKSMPVTLENFNIYVHKDLEPEARNLMMKEKKLSKKVSAKKKKDNDQEKKILDKMNLVGLKKEADELKRRKLDKAKHLKWKSKYKSSEENDLQLLLPEEDKLTVKKAVEYGTQDDGELHAEWIIKEKKETDGGREYIRVEKKGKEREKTKRRTNFLSASGSYLIVTDIEENSLSTSSFSWTPHVWLTRRWGLRGQFGFNYLQTKETDLDSDQFLVIDLGLVGVLHFDNFYFELGVGIQRWSDETAESYGTAIYGVGYKFSHYLLYFIDRAFFNYVAVANDVSNREFRWAVGISF